MVVFLTLIEHLFQHQMCITEMNLLLLTPFMLTFPLQVEDPHVHNSLSDVIRLFLMCVA